MTHTSEKATLVWKPGQTSQKVQHRNISDPTKNTFYKNHRFWLLSTLKQSNTSSILALTFTFVVAFHFVHQNLWGIRDLGIIQVGWWRHSYLTCCNQFLYSEMVGMLKHLHHAHSRPKLPGKNLRYLIFWYYFFNLLKINKTIPIYLKQKKPQYIFQILFNAVYLILHWTFN